MFSSFSQLGSDPCGKYRMKEAVEISIQMKPILSPIVSGVMVTDPVKAPHLCEHNYTFKEEIIQKTEELIKKIKYYLCL